MVRNMDIRQEADGDTLLVNKICRLYWFNLMRNAYWIILYLPSSVVFYFFYSILKKANKTIKY